MVDLPGRTFSILFSVCFDFMFVVLVWLPFFDCFFWGFYWDIKVKFSSEKNLV